MKYLAPYVFRVAISNRRRVKLENDQFTFRYRATDTGQLKLCTLSAEEFIHRFLQHVLPKDQLRNCLPYSRNLVVDIRLNPFYTQIEAQIRGETFPLHRPYNLLCFIVLRQRMIWIRLRLNAAIQGAIMNAQKLSQSVFIGALITLFLAGCGVPQAVPQTKSTTDTATPEPPTVTNTLTLPTATATPSWNVVVGEKIILGPAEAIVTMLEEAQTSPVLDKPPQAGMKFILIGLNIVSQEPGETFASDRLFLETSSGRQYSAIRIYGPQPWSEGFNIIFEVATGESLSNLLLSYN